ncbi:MAG: sigma-54-dependent Fis family transcriptional regulator [Candidatus Scalindua rubra]|uniref:Transcriptional regulator n=1 Tax=Candidatus Scalindua brodae TaxID=237368 RepID=A0A0B0EGV6_9BACT|nr:MAG: transcriptional regulator [Candidatus Scalindua brodae]MBZ0109384.1 sigma-54-dependent Fis family transcriptional regulator [Candidatus Scalindua rubra]TWU34828.1 Transcriptional regulatory protein ZraR [Candidatus Brocadiaceae bacterium S225]
MKAKILIIDDEESIRITIKEFLLKEGYDILVAKSYEETEKIIDTERIDIVLSDIVLGGKSGIDVLRNVNERHLKCPVVLFTGYPNLETASEAVHLGAYDYITKPVEKMTLLHTVRMALRHKSLIEERDKNHAILKATFKSVKDAIITVDNVLKIIEINDAATKICGLLREDVLGKSFESIPKMCSGQCVEVIKKTIQKKLPVEVYRLECKHETRKEQIVSMNTFPLMDKIVGMESIDGIDGCVMVAKDETHVSGLEKELESRQRLSNIIGKDEKMQGLYSLMENLYNIDTTVIITGESGTGKGLIAEAIHYGGVRRQGAFVKVDCSALTETLLESELFGHVKGAFTGAVTDKIGRFQKADGGTIFLDEIGDVSLDVQQRLLRVIQEKEFERVGDSTPITADARIVAATNKDLQEKVRLGEFREDLYYRLKIIELSSPPLRDRRGDIPLLVEHFIERFNQKLKKNINNISDDVYKIFMNYEWPGNIRELENAIEHSFVVCNKTIIDAEDLPGELREIKATPSVDEKSDEYNTILQVLEKTKWNKTNAAKLMGISRRTIYNKIKEYNISPE